MKMDINKELFSLYSGVDIYKLVDDYNNKLSNDEEKTACPLFLQANERYMNADIKLLIFGQETNRWNGIYGRGISVECITSVYDGFFNSGNCYIHGGQFWNGIKHVMELLREKNKGKKIDFLWNNIVKMGYNGKGKKFPYKFYENIIKPHLNNLIIKEIEILKPDFILFLTGPDYDHVLNDIFGNPQRKSVDGFTEEQLCEIVIPNVKKSIRTYHPHSLCRKGKKDMDNYYEKIINEITEKI
jgi:hypothetical protein